MISRASPVIRMLCSVMAMLALLAGIASIQVLAASNGIYLATASPHYRHPITGVIEDSGGQSSEVLGQSMTESALHDTALVEVDASGNTFVTVRMKLMDNIEDPQFQVASGSGVFSPVEASLMQEDYTQNTADFRMQVPDENAVLRCNMYVIPMGREVIFYITVSGLTAGSGDFVTSVTVEQQTTVQGSPSSQAAVSQPESSVPVSSQPAASQPESSLSESSQVSSRAVESSAAGLEEFDASGNEVSQTASQPEQSSGNLAAVGWVVGGVVVVAAAGGCVWYFVFFRKKR